MRVGEPVFKKTFPKPIPNDAKIFSRKKTKYAKYKSAQGQIQETRLTRDGKKLLCETQSWYIRFDDHEGIKRVLKAYNDKGASDYLHTRIVEFVNYKRRSESIPAALQTYLSQDENIKEQLIKFGLLSDVAMIGEKTLEEHLEDFQKHLTNKERNQKHIKEVAGTLRSTFENCGFVSWADITAEALKNYLDGKRDKGTGISKRRYNAILGKVKYFCRWMVKRQKQNGDLAAVSPVEFLDGLDNPQTDARHPRRALELDDLRRFLDASLTGPEKFGLTGRERNFIYRFAAETAMRKIDFNRLRVRDCDFKNSKITIVAGRIKNKQDAEIFLKPTTTIELKQYCSQKLPDAKVFHLPDKTAKMIRFDLANTAVKDAGGKEIVPAIPYRDKFGKIFDFHSLRHQSASLYGMNPETSEAVRQRLTRHKNPAMARHYTHAFEEQQRQAVEDLPDLTKPSAQTQIQVRTGTDGDCLSNACFMDDTVQHNTTQGGKESKKAVGNMQLQAINKAQKCIPKPKVACSNHAGRSQQTPENTSLTGFSEKSNESQFGQHVLYEFYSPDFDPKLQEVIKSWPNLPEQIKAEILRLIG